MKVSRYLECVAVHRKRLRRFEIVNQPRFLTFSCCHRLPLFSNDAIKDAFVLHLQHVRSQAKFRLLAWVIMPDHVHLILVPDLPRCPVPEVLRALKRSFAQRVVRRWKELRAPILDRLADPQGVVRFWQRGGGYDRNVLLDGELMEKIEYVHNNPVRRGLVSAPVEWRWSSAAWYAGVRDGCVSIDPIQ